MSAKVPQSLAVAVAANILASGVFAQSDSSVAFVQAASKEQRRQYLAAALIWSDPGHITPEMLLAGQPLPQVPALEAAIRGEPVPCGFVKPGNALGGNTPKFACRTPGGRTIRVKYGDGSKNGNREIYSAVAAARLVWFLGFESDPIYPITIDCNDCPADPMSGTGPRTRRAYLATFQPSFKNVVIVDGTNPNQGWSWGEVDEAIEELPEGPVRARQRAHFDALTLLGVLLQHGDRKPQQQRLECRGALDLSAGDIHPLQGADSEAYSTPVFFEHPGATACSNPVIAIQDLGATFGGAGRATKGSTAKMNLQAWTKRPVFQPAKPARPGDVPECRGNLTTSMAAGELARGNPRVGEAGRALLQDRLQQLTDAHLQALLTTARVDKLPEAQTWKDSRGIVHTGSDAWIAAFKDKVRQITEQRCAP